MGFGAYDARLSALEQIIIIIILNGGWRPGGGGPSVDPGPGDYTRMEALARAFIPHRPPPGDSFANDLSRFSLAEAEEKALQVSAEITRLQALHGELNARLKDLRAKK